MVDLFSDIFLAIQFLLFFLFDAYTNKLESSRIKFVIPTFQLYATHDPSISPQGPHSAYNILRSMGEIHCERDWLNTLCACTVWYPHNVYEVLRQSGSQC